MPQSLCIKADVWEEDKLFLETSIALQSALADWNATIQCTVHVLQEFCSIH